jgi:hypothetical protein
MLSVYREDGTPMTKGGLQSAPLERTSTGASDATRSVLSGALCASSRLYVWMLQDPTGAYDASGECEAIVSYIIQAYLELRMFIASRS